VQNEQLKLLLELIECKQIYRSENSFTCFRLCKMLMTSLKSRLRTTSFSMAISDRWLSRWSDIVERSCFWLVRERKTTLSWAIRGQKRQIDAQSNVNVRERFPNTQCRNNVVQAKLKADGAWGDI